MLKIGFNFFRDPGRATLSNCEICKKELEKQPFFGHI
jgi:hypothetical protein